MKQIFLFLVFTFIVIFMSNAQSILDDTIKLKEVVITANKTEVTRNNIPLTISVINKMEIENSNESALLPVISNNVPGVFVTERGVTGFGVSDGAAGQISIRGVGGFPNTQVLLLLDGHPQYMGIMGHPLPDAYVASDVERVEVVRGPASILYGSNAMGGVINIITKKQKTDGISINARSSFGSFNTQKYMASAGFRKKGFSTFLSYNHDQTDGHRASSDFKIDNAYAKIAYDILDELTVYTDISLAKFYTQDPGPISVPNTLAPHWIDILRGKTSFALENNFSNFQGALKVFHNFGEHKLYDGFHSNDINSGLILYQSIRPFAGNLTTIGLDFKTFGGFAENTIMDACLNDTTLYEMAAYILSQQNFNDILILNAGLRLENHSVYGQEWVPQAGISYNLNENSTIKAIASKGFRSPTIRELYMFPPQNAELLPEELWNYELGYLQNINDNINFELSAFHNKGSNMIKLVRDGGMPKYQNTGEFSNFGGEFLTNIRINKNLRFNINYSYLYMEKPIISSPEHALNFSGNYRFNDFILNLSLQSINGLYSKLVPEDPDKDVKVNYIVLNARLSYNITKEWNIFVAANNILNSEYEINFEYPMPGINFNAGINFKLFKDL
ncbi:MAG: TonB-dependent receptor [Bacteroidales bacterium]|nr:TonB-dependent receptor [Bacteroidales bacterium]